MVWMTTYHLHRVKQTRMWVAVVLCWLCLVFATPKIPHSPDHHLFADMRNFLGTLPSKLASPPLFLCRSCFSIWVLCLFLVFFCFFFAGVPNTLNVITNYPFLVVGVLGFVLCLSGNFFVIRFLSPWLSFETIPKPNLYNETKSLL